MNRPHSDVAYPLNNLASLYHEQGKYEQAKLLYQPALAIREQRLGLKHPDTVDTRTRYACLLRVCGRSEEAAALEAASIQQATTTDQPPS